MSTNLVILGRPPGRALFNVKSRTLRVLTTMVSSPWQFHSLFFSLFFTWNKKQELTPFSNQDNEKNFYLGYSHTSPTLGVCIAGQQNFKCVEFKSPSIVILSIKCTKVLQSVQLSCSQALPIHRSLRSPPGVVSDQKYPKENFILEHALAFIEGK